MLYTTRYVYNMWTKRAIFAILLFVMTFSVITCDLTACNMQALTCRTAQANDLITGAEAQSHWKLAMDYKQSRRYELARHHLLLALVSCKSTESRDVLQRELQLIDFQIRTLR